MLAIDDDLGEVPSQARFEEPASESMWQLYCAAITAEQAADAAARSGSEVESRTARARRDAAFAAWGAALEGLTKPLRGEQP